MKFEERNLYVASLYFDDKETTEVYFWNTFLNMQTDGEETTVVDK